jgi:alcohol dehydrogenase (NADP+)
VDCAFVGAGAVAERYAAGLAGSPLSLAAVCDLEQARAADLAAAHGADAYGSLEAMLDASDVPLFVNLTSHAAHAEVTRQCLTAGRHVFSEKPLALSAATARELCSTAERAGLALGCAPINHRCDAQRHAARLLADGRFGPVRIGYAHAHVGRVPEWHDRPASFLEVGPLYDGAVYPLSLLVSWFGPVGEVRVADALGPWPDRDAHAPDGDTHVEATLAFDTGPTVRLTASTYVPHRSREFNSLELHGDEGSLYLADAGALADERGTVSVAGAGREYTPAPNPRPRGERRYLSGPERLAESIADGAAPTASARRGAHVVAICEAIEAAAAGGDPQSVPDCDLDSTGETGGVDPVVGPATSESAVASEPGGRAGDGTAGLRLPPIGLGCSRYRDGEYVDRAASIATALDAGYRLLDSAELYGNEFRIGRLLAAPGAPDRERLFLISKVWNTNHEHVREACEGTLEELGVDSLDCYMLHWPDAWAYQGPLTELARLPPERQEALTFPETAAGERATGEASLPETWRRMESLYEAGLARSLGICNVSLSQLETILEVARIPPAIVQVESHPYRPRESLVAACHERGIRVIAHSPLSAPGLLSEPDLEAIAADREVTPAAIALAWQVDRGVVPIPSSTDREHLVANLAAARISLTDRERARIDGLADPEFER